MRRGARMPRQGAAIAILALVVAGCASPATPVHDPTSGSDGAGPTATGRPHSTPAAHRKGGSPFASLAGYLAHREGTVTAAVYDKRTGRFWVWNGRVREDTASIVKVEIMGTALREAESAGTPLPPAEQALIPTMIENSDNDAATTMLAKVGGPSAVMRFDRLAGLTQTTVSTLALIPGTALPGWGLTKTTALDEVRLVSRFAYPNAILSSASRNYGLNLMEHVEADQAWGVSGGVPAGVTVALKNGWLPHNLAANSDWQVNSIGWITGDGRDYVLAVLTNHSPSQAYGEETIGAIATRMFAELGPGSAGS
jgi:Beta-lactamase enzyme family